MSLILNKLREFADVDIGEVFAFEGYDYECYFTDSDFKFTYTNGFLYTESEKENLKAKLLGWLVMGKPIISVPFKPKFDDEYYTIDKTFCGHWIVVKTTWKNSSLDYLRDKCGWVFSSDKRANLFLNDFLLKNLT